MCYVKANEYGMHNIDIVGEVCQRTLGLDGLL